MARTILVLEKRDIAVSMNDDLTEIEINLTNGDSIVLSVEVARKLVNALENKVAEADNPIF
jgi:predicted methyltransferase